MRGVKKQAEKLKSREMKDDKGGSKRMKDIDFKLLGVLIYDR